MKLPHWLRTGDGSISSREGLGWEEMKKLMAHSSAGLHTMVDEHFGIRWGQ